MDKEELVRNAVRLARDKGVRFESGSPTFRVPKGKKVNDWFTVRLIIYSKPNTHTSLPITKRFDFLEGYDENTLADFFIDTFNEHEIEQPAQKL